MNEAATAKQLLVLEAVNRVTKINGDPWCTDKEVKTFSGLDGRSTSRLLTVLVDRGWLEQYKEGYRQSIWLEVGRKRFCSLISSTEKALFIVQNFMIRFANRKMFDLIHYSFDELTAKPFIEFVHQDDRQLLYDRHSARLKGEKVEDDYSFHFVDKDSSVAEVGVHIEYSEWDSKIAMLTSIDSFKKVGILSIFGLLPLISSVYATSMVI